MARLVLCVVSYVSCKRIELLCSKGAQSAAHNLYAYYIAYDEENLQDIS